MSAKRFLEERHIELKGHIIRGFGDYEYLAGKKIYELMEDYARSCVPKPKGNYDSYTAGYSDAVGDVLKNTEQ